MYWQTRPFKTHQGHTTTSTLAKRSYYYRGTRTKRYSMVCGIKITKHGSNFARLKDLIKSAKRHFTWAMLSSKKPKEVWKIIHPILHPNPQRLTLQHDKLNSYFANTAERTIGINAAKDEENCDSLKVLIDALPSDCDNGFCARTVSYGEVIRELRSLWVDFSMSGLFYRARSHPCEDDQNGGRVPGVSFNWCY